MRALPRLSILFLALLLATTGVQGATWEEQQFLGRRGAESGARPLRPTTSPADAALAAWRAAAEPPPPSWRERLWPWNADANRQQLVHITPVYPDGRGAAAHAELVVPPAQLARERELGLRPAPTPSSGGAGEPGRRPPLLAADASSYYAYNSSDLSPLVPLWLAWMTDDAGMSARSKAAGLDFGVARAVSAHVAVSYCNVSNIAPWNCSRCQGDADGFATQRVVYDPQWNLLGFVGYSTPLNAIMVVFRGTDSHSLYNWVENMRTWRTDYAMVYPEAPQYAYVHGGFFYSYNSSALAPNVTAAVAELRAAHPSAPVYVAGHSLGGALATICAMDLRLNLNITDVHVFTFGSPRVGNQIFADWFRQKVKAHYRFTHNRDIVPSVPPTYMGFHHVSREIWLVDLLVGHPLVGICDASGEDALCHAAVCHLGLCSSLADHLMYLSEMYLPRPQGC